MLWLGVRGKHCSHSLLNCMLNYLGHAVRRVSTDGGADDGPVKRMLLVLIRLH